MDDGQDEADAMKVSEKDAEQKEVMKWISTH